MGKIAFACVLALWLSAGDLAAMQSVLVPCSAGVVQVEVGGVGIATPTVEGLYPGCTITVYIHGTITPATIFSDNAVPPTSLGNPFTAGSTIGAGAGYGVFYVAGGRYDVRVSGGTPAPGISPAFTFTDIQAFDPIGPNPDTGGIRFADQFGSDWCANINSASSALGGPGEIWLGSLAASSTCSASVTLTQGQTLRIIQGSTAVRFDLGTHQFLLNSGSGIVSEASQQYQESPYSFYTVAFSYEGTGSAIKPANSSAITFNVSLRGFELYGSSSGAIGLDLLNAASWDLRNLAVYNFSATGAFGLRLRGQGLGGAYWNRGDHLYFGTDDTCMMFNSDNANDVPNRGYWTDVICKLATNGLWIDAGDQHVSNFHTQGTTAYGVYFNGDNSTCLDCFLENASQSPPYNNSYGVYFTQASNTKGAGNYFLGTSAGMPTGHDYGTGSTGNQISNGNQLVFTAVYSSGNGSQAALHVIGSQGLPGAGGFIGGGGLWAASGFASPSQFRIYCGDGTGYECEFAKHDHTTGNDTVLWAITDGGAVIGPVPAYTINGTPRPGEHLVRDSEILGIGGTITITLSGSAAFASSTSYSCMASDYSRVQAIQTTYSSGTSVTFGGGIAGDGITIVCQGE